MKVRVFVLILFFVSMASSAEVYADLWPRYAIQVAKLVRSMCIGARFSV
jgi:hypothetical protein